ncbi:MAG: cobalamin-dependent protein [Blautia sp.]|nr:cobalamin-dependent protein [Blautia sp.]
MQKILQDIKEAIEQGHSIKAEKLVQAGLDEGLDPFRIVQEAMIPAMRDAGRYYKENEYDIPRILSAARGMRKGLDILEPYLNGRGCQEIGSVILGTVKGDLHDVGKNLVAVMFRSEGFRVIDLGVDVSEKEFLRAIRENPDVTAVCISSLLTTTRSEMAHVVRAIRNTPDLAHVKIMVGGGSVTREFAESIGADVYTETAVDAAEAAKAFLL